MSSPRPGQSIEDHVDELRADGKLGDEDVDAIKKFAAFLRDVGQAPSPEELEHPERAFKLSLDVLERHQDILGLSDADLERRRAQEAAGPPPDAPVALVHHVRMTPAVAQHLETGGSVRTLCCGRESDELPERDSLASLASSTTCPGRTDG